MSIVQRINWWYAEICACIHIWIIQLVNFIQNLAFRATPGKQPRTVLILGDCVAAGVGDSLGKCGLAPRLTQLLATAGRESGLHQSWRAITLGVPFSTTKDWAPGSMRGYLESALLRGPFRGADVVVFILGAHDSLTPPEVPSRALAEAARFASRLGKEVIVASMPNFANRRTAQADFAAGRDRGIICQRFIEDAARHAKEAGDEGRITGGVDWEKVLARRGDVICVENRFITLNSFGYRAFAREVYDVVQGAAKRVEWKHWKSRLMEQQVEAPTM